METVKSPAIGFARRGDSRYLGRDLGPAASRLQYYNQGFADLPNNRDVALPNLQKAVANFDEVLKEAPQGLPQARAAALGSAALEARNELSKAITQYELVVTTWPESIEAEEAKKLAAAPQEA